MIGIVRLKLFDSRVCGSVEEVFDELRMVMADLEAEAELPKRHARECQHVVISPASATHRHISMSMRCDSAAE